MTGFFKALLAMGILILVSKAQATKCLIAKTEADFMKSFPIVIDGVVEERDATSSSPDAKEFTIKIRIKKVLKGKFDAKLVDGSEYLPSGRSTNFKIGEEFIFPVDEKKKVSGFEAIIPAYGCSDLPKPKSN